MKKITNKQLAEYLNVSASAVSQYDKRKLKLMKLGLKVIKNPQLMKQML